jgi:hypothetical protein
LPVVDALQLTVLVVATAMLAVSGALIVWRELGGDAAEGFVRRGRDLLGLLTTVGGAAVLLVWLWARA